MEEERKRRDAEERRAREAEAAALHQLKVLHNSPSTLPLFLLRLLSYL